MITKSHLNNLLPEILELISKELSFTGKIALAECSRTLYEAVGRGFWRNLCLDSSIPLQSDECFRKRFFEHLRARDPKATFTLAVVMSNDQVLKYNLKLAKTYFDLALIHPESTPELRSSISRHLERICYLDKQSTGILDQIVSFATNYFFPHEYASETYILKTINDFEKYVNFSLTPELWSDYNKLKVDTATDISTEIGVQATSYYCYQWATNNLPHDGKEIFNKLINTPNLPHSVQNRIERLKAIRHFTFHSDASNDSDVFTLSDNEASLILLNACKDESLSFTEKMIDKKILIEAKTDGLIDDIILTPVDCNKLVYDIDNRFSIDTNVKAYLLATSQMAFFQRGQNNVVYMSLGRVISRNSYSKTLRRYCQLCAIKVVNARDPAFYSFKDSIDVLNRIIQDPPTSDYAKINHMTIVSEATDLLSKYTQLESLNFENLSTKSQKKILSSEITDPNELEQEFNFLLAQDYFDTRLFYRITREQAFEILENIVQSIPMGDEEMKNRWEQRYVIALNLLKKFKYS